MGNYHQDFRPLPADEAQPLNAIITQAARSGQAVVIDPDRGVTDVQPVNLISPNENLGGVIRFKRHYGGGPPA